jgi:short-subunit dehydrogenase
MSDFSHRYGPWAVVTGASSGIGRGFAQALSERGLNLVLVARREDELRQLAGDLPTDALVVAADLSTDAGLDAVDDATADLDVGLLIAAAGFGSSGPFLDADPTRQDAMLDVNVRAVLRQSAAFGGRFAARGRGGLVLFGSVLGFQGVPGAAHYAATKAYVQTLGEALHVEMKPRGVDVLVVAPGPVRTEFADEAGLTYDVALGVDDVVGPALGALGKHQTVRPGLLSKALATSVAALPRWARVRAMGRVMAGLSAS